MKYNINLNLNFFGFLLIVNIILKLTKVINWSWWIVLWPLWISIILTIITIFIILITIGRN